MTEAPKEFWVVVGPEGRFYSYAHTSADAIRCTVVHPLGKPDVDVEAAWADMERKGWQCVKYTRSE